MTQHILDSVIPQITSGNCKGVFPPQDQFVPQVLIVEILTEDGSKKKTFFSTKEFPPVCDNCDNREVCGAIMGTVQSFASRIMTLSKSPSLKT